MSRYRGIALALGSLLVLTACSGSGSGEAGPTEPSRHPATKSSTSTATTTTSSERSGPPSTERHKIDVTVTHPKRANADTSCQEVITTADVAAATGAPVTDTSIAPFICYYSVAKAPLSGHGVLTIAFFGADPYVSATVTTLAGNTAVEERQDDKVCTFFVVLDGKKQLDAKGAVLGVDAQLTNLVDPCQAAREIVAKGFARLPDA